MAALEKMIAMATLVKTMIDNALRQRIVGKLVVVIMLATFTAVLASFLAAASCYAGYIALLHYGLTPEAAFYAITSCLVVIVILCVCLTRHHVRALCRSLQPLTPLTEKIDEIVSAFADGFQRKNI